MTHRFILESLRSVRADGKVIALARCVCGWCYVASVLPTDENSAVLSHAHKAFFAHAPGMQNWFLSFGQKFRREPHRAGGHPDGWFRIMALNEPEATDIAFYECGREWSRIISEDLFDPSFYPTGELRVL